MIVMVRGVIYQSVPEAAERLGLTPAAVYSALHNNRMDKLGTGTSRRKPITLHGVSFPSVNAASKALGFGRTYLWNAINRNTDFSRQRVADAVAAYKEQIK